MASSLSGASALGIFNGLGWLWTSDSECQPGDKPNNFGPGCTTGGWQNDSCLEKGMVYDYAKGDCVQKSSGGGDFVACQPGQVYIYDDAGNPACVSQAEWEKIKAKRQSTGGSTKSVTPITPGVTVEDGVDWKPLAAMAVLAAAVVTIIVRKRNRGMTSNCYDEDC